MQFTNIAVLLAAAFTVSAALGADTISKRSCGTLTGTALTICQDACKATCDIATGGIVRKLCKEACDLGPLKARDAEAATVEAAANEVVERGFGREVCDAACDVTCNSTVLALDQLECLKICKSKC